MSIRQMFVLTTFSAICAAIGLYIQRSITTGEPERQYLPFFGLWGTFVSPFVALVFARFWNSSTSEESSAGYAIWLVTGLILSVLSFILFLKTAHWSF